MAEGKVPGLPTKEFFISMLTRDIELNDAILDLLDNCLDGVMRSKDKPPQEGDFQYYNGFWAKINITQNSFTITDNCGGIPYDKAIDYAFRMGKPKNKTDDTLPTVGIYGIGMKRAIFKMGLEATVYSKTHNKSFCVHIPEDWANQGDLEWDFPIEEMETQLEENGTSIHIEKIVPDVAKQWEEDGLSSFIDSLIGQIKYHYSFIIEKGFGIFVNDEIVKPNSVKLLFSNQQAERRMSPYLYQTVIEGVDVKIALGFYNPMISEEDIEKENEGRRSSLDAGWTILCNDRVVLYNNKDYQTGWGEANVPRYHTQFIGIRGVVVFRSNNPIKLPMTTTKRGIDLSSPIYSEIKNKMRDGLKIFTDYTNKWKGLENQEREVSEKSQSVDLKDLLQPHENISKNLNIHFTPREGGYYFTPKLPEPISERKEQIIRFSKPPEEINEVTFYLYGEPRPSIKPSEVGEQCFDKIYKEARGKRK